ncbi:FHIP family protein GA25918 isoform X3 [Phlebotomus papatasi]|uniref:FHIP family protein GA25918 isoform X3 n=1 Tax=Phlebotomus papatasi TaxID=29031 RepID=UPI0024846D5E|nr:FHIP family protein GA25918 isoform X3 [Phlebotomus papatasi]XP_055716921.1 FHIP family protein GA25918 isoform X3 [Phlebotomus papatasi]XP_055716922.1 FHIP family protein GA25918 isoform X3 [Phlebotomus papatasi]XP_055716923.1 FHIP family protein GA25918 isoform X3 [Phlebotomus papatasi]XP_055716924.1 FHIP family protein GA25918 isoform X3 [Phlebotomus papatasi]XP_055716925.1 FHIP family protein GA25918 isoform X3 [Phlebotomus papatasi]
MSWLRSSPLRQSFTNSSRSGGVKLDNATELDPGACYDSFCKHWQQAYDVIQRSEGTNVPSHDDILSVVNHLDQMVTFLLVELIHCNKVSLPSPPQTFNSQQTQSQPSAPCLEFMLSKNILNKLFDWGKSTGRYANAVLLEQLKFYEQLVNHSRHQLLVHEPFLRPLLKILASSHGEIFPMDVAKRFVVLLHQLCVVLMQNVHLLDLFFVSGQTSEHGQANFIIFSLLIPYIHREGLVGHKARDALLLCMALSQKNENVRTYIEQYSSVCPVLVTGLGGLYSLLPTTIDTNSTTDWHRITPDDVAEMNELTLFMSSLEFCNAVVQVAHEVIKHQLLDFMYQGFVVPVLGSTLLQIFNGSPLQTNIEAQVSTMAYFDLILRSVTEPGLLSIFIKFLLDEEKFDGQRIIDILVERINSTDTRLCLISLSVFDTLLSLNNEEIVVELVLKYLTPCQHIPTSYRHRINKISALADSAENFLDLAPEIMKHVDRTKKNPSNASVTESPNKSMGNCQWNHYSLHIDDTLYSNYHAYLFDVRHKIILCRNACDLWVNSYKYQNISSPKRTHNTDHLIDIIRKYVADCKSENCADEKTKHDSLQSLAESSGYESFRERPDDDLAIVTNGDHTEISNTRKFWKESRNFSEPETELNFSEDLFTQGTAHLGSFLGAIFGKLQTFTSNNLYINLHLSGLISRLSWYPFPLIQSIFLRFDIPTTTDIPSFYQVLQILKQQLDAELPVDNETLEIVENAKAFLLEREYRLVNQRKNTIDTNAQITDHSTSATTTVSPMSSLYDPFKRQDSTRKSIRQSFSSIFRRPSASGSSSGNSIMMKETSEPQSLDSWSSINSSIATTSKSNGRTKDLAICAVVLDEWLKELSAISQEQSILMIP